MADAPPILGSCDSRFAAVREAFVSNFTQRGESGAAVCVVIDGRVVVDLCGGWADLARQRPWQPDTLVNFFSVGKAVSTLCVLRLVERGAIDLDAPVARYWPAFGSAGKEAITTRQILSHRAGLPAIRELLPAGSMLDWPRMIAALERQQPWWEPGSDHGYHVNTFGFLVGELVRRVAGVSLGTFLRDEISGPLAADVHIGTPDELHRRIAEFRWPVDEIGPAPDLSAISEDQRMRWSTYFNPAGLSGDGWVNRAEWRRAELPSTNGHGSARGVARLYAALAGGGALAGLDVVGTTILREATTEHSSGMDRITERPSRFGLGFQLTQPERPLGPNSGAFGHFGAGGALGFCDPAAGIAFGYVMNDLGPRWQNPRNKALIDGVYESL